MRPTPDRLLTAALTFAAGFGAGLLAAPRPGMEARRRLVGSARGAALAAQDGVRGAAAPLATRVREARHEMTQRHVPLSGEWDVVDGRDLLRALQGPSRS